jgi:molybdopterin/thiamine biosynthesis adenylyltransferase
MNESILRETNYRGQELTDKLANTEITVCGAGALGSNFIHEIVRQGAYTIKVIDFDRVEEHNISTQMYGYSHIGQLKVRSIQSLIWMLFNLQIRTYSRELTNRNAEQELKGSELVIDTFDNPESRNLVIDTCNRLNIPCLHLGMSEDGHYGNAIWDIIYYHKGKSGFNDPCEVPATRNLISIVVAMGCELVIEYVKTGEHSDLEFTLKDMRITTVR